MQPQGLFSWRVLDFSHLLRFLPPVPLFLPSLEREAFSSILAHSSETYMGRDPGEFVAFSHPLLNTLLGSQCRKKLTEKQLFVIECPYADTPYIHGE